MYGIFIHCTRALPFIAWILARVKLWETRNSDVLRDLVGQRVALIDTGKRINMVLGYATITRSKVVNYTNVRARKAARIYGTPYDIKPGGTKMFYRLANVQRITPYPLPADHVNSGRSFTRF